MESRPRREKKARVDLSALDALEKAKSGVTKRAHQVQIKQAESLFDVVDEEEYAKLVSKRRQDDFVEDDEGEDLGYRDDGEEAWNRQESSEDEYEEDATTAKKLGMVSDKKPVVEDKKLSGIQKISMMLQRQGQTKTGKPGNEGQLQLGSVGLKRKPEPTSNGKASESNLEELLLASGLAGPAAKDGKAAPAPKDRKGGAFASSRAAEPKAKARPAQPKTAGTSPMDSRYRPTVPQRKKIQSLEDELLRGPLVGAFAGDDDAEAAGGGDSAGEEMHDGGAADTPAAAAVTVKAEGGGVVERKSGGFARADAQSDARLRAIAEQDDWRAMREAALKEQAAGTDSADTPMVDEDVKPCIGELQVPVEADGSLNFFWIDAYEDINKPGRIYLFGKIRNGEAQGKPAYTSCCLQVDGIERHAFILPREKILDCDGNATEVAVDMVNHVLPEFMQIARSKGIKKHRCKPTTRKYMYHFEDPDVPVEAEYLKVVYSAEFPALPSDLAGRSFRRVFGATQSCMELFLLKRDLMGPCWLNIKDVQPVASALSWCKAEVRVGSPKSVAKITDRPPDSPPLCVMSVHLQTVLNERERCNEIVMISALCHPEVSIEGQTDRPEGRFFSFTGVRKLDGQAWPLDLQQKMDEANRREAVAPKSIHPNERALLNFFLAKVHTIDPDFIVGHNFMGFDLDVLLHRMQRSKIPAWSKLGRLRRNVMPKLQTNAGGMGQSTWGEKMIMSGRLVCDTYIAAKENLRETTYTLAELARTQLGKTRQEVDFHQVPEYFSKTSDLMKLIAHNENDTYLAILLMFKMMVLPLTKQLTNLAGNLWSRSLLSARAERVEYLLLHEFHRLKYVMPDKAVFNSKKPAPTEDLDDDDNEDGGAQAPAGAGKQKWTKKKKAAYAGGLVLEPKRGLYDKHILLLDFNSLYPSIIQEYNICFTTVAPPRPAADSDVARYELPNKDGQTGILPRVIKTLVDRRRQVKALIKAERDSVKLQQYDIRQTALKIMANSMYGCLGFTFSRFYAKPLAEMITAQGRELLQRTVEVTQTKMQLEVVYGDTDSIFINSGSDNLQEATRIANETKKELNKMWKLLEVGLDGIYCPLLLLNKKKYAALSVTERDGVITKVKEKKGLDIVRRDWCHLARRAGDKILDFILSGDPVDEVVNNIHTFLRQIADDMDNNRLALEEFVINKGLTKAPEEYSDGKTQPHVQVALKMKKQGIAIRAGDHIAYVICADDSQASYAQRAWSPADVHQADGKLVVDKKWYLESQLHPVVSRMCAVIQGTDSGQLAECLGLEASKFHRQDAANRTDHESAFAHQAQEVDRFAAVEKLSATCSDGVLREFPGVFVKDAMGKWTLGMSCADPAGVRFNAKAMRLQLGALMRRCAGRYHDGWLVCADGTCAHRTRNLMCSVHRDGDQVDHGLKCPIAGCPGKMKLEYTSEQLYLQLLYLQKLFDVKHMQRKVDEENRARAERGLAMLTPPPVPSDVQAELDALRGDAEAALALSAYNAVDLGALFSSVASLADAAATV